MKTAFYGWSTVSLLQRTAYAAIVKQPASFGLRRFIRQPGVWINGRLGGPRPGSSIEYNWIEEPLEITPTEITVRIRDDATWSDGHPITGTDIALRPLEVTLSQFSPPPAYAPPDQTEPYSTPDEPRRIQFAFDDFKITDSSVTYRSSDGYFGQFTEKLVALFLAPFHPTISPTHVAPFETYADTVIETVRRAQAGEIHPWYRRGFSDPTQQSLIKEHLADPEYVRKFSKPENVLGTGMWNLVDYDGTDFVFEPHSHHPQSDVVNFDSVRFVFTRGTEPLRAAVKDDRFDFGSLGTTPQAVIDAFPDGLRIVRVPGGLHSGNELAVNHGHPALGNRNVRMAIMYALDQPTIAKNIHQSITEPVSTPGGDSWNATEFVSENWIDENLTTYSRNRTLAANLMGKAGYTKDGGQWVDADGQALALTLPTTSSEPKWESTVASQLSAFGINTTVQTLDASVFENRRDNGEFAIWASSGTATSGATHTLFIWRNAASSPDKFGIYPDAQFKRGEFSDSGTPVPKTEERYRIFTIEAPPVGQPDGPLKEYHPATLALTTSHLSSLTREEFRRRVKIGMWLANWYLPTIPINKRYIQWFIDEAHWLWPTDTTSWKRFTDGGGSRVPKEVLGNLPLRANPDNPE
jgi:ABC-type transport system substrate-binding protein